MQAYRIANWKELYEVTNKGGAAKADTPTEQLKKGPLKYVRWRAYGRRQTEAYRNLLKKAWLQGTMAEMGIFGLFGKLIELAADQEREYRGWVLNRHLQPAGAKEIAGMLGICDVGCVEKGLQLLTDRDIGWVEIADFRGSPRTSAEARGALRGTSADVPALFDIETETKVKRNIIETQPPEKKEAECGVSDSEKKTLNIKVSASKQTALLRTAEILNISVDRRGDTTTLQHIFRQVAKRVEGGECEIDIFGEMVEKAKQCSGQYRVPVFVKAMKEPRFGYVPERRKIIPSNFTGVK